MGVDAGTDGGSAERHRQQLVAGGLHTPDRLLDLAGVALELLAEPDRRGVLEMRPAGLHDRPERLGLPASVSWRRTSAGMSASSMASAAAQLEGRRDVVVRALAPIDVVVRMDPPAITQARRREVGHDLVHVRVGRGARARLVDVDRELVVVVAVAPRRRGRRDRRARRRRRAGRARHSSRPRQA